MGLLIVEREVLDEGYHALFLAALAHLGNDRTGEESILGDVVIVAPAERRAVNVCAGRIPAAELVPETEVAVDPAVFIGEILVESSADGHLRAPADYRIGIHEVAGLKIRNSCKRFLYAEGAVAVRGIGNAHALVGNKVESGYYLFDSLLYSELRKILFPLGIVKIEPGHIRKLYRRRIFARISLIFGAEFGSRCAVPGSLSSIVTGIGFVIAFVEDKIVIATAEAVFLVGQRHFKIRQPFVALYKFGSALFKILGRYA